VPSHAIAICDTPQGRRTVVRSEDQALLESMTREEFLRPSRAGHRRRVRAV